MATSLFRATQLTLLAAAAILVGCSGGMRASFPTEEEVRGKLHRGMTADEVLATFGEPPGHQWVDVRLGGKVRYIAPAAARTRKTAGYAGFTVYFDRGKVWDWEVITMNPSYEHRLLPSAGARWALGTIALLLVGVAAYAVLLRVWLLRKEQKELFEAYMASDIPRELPADFRFITAETTLQTVLEQAGPASRRRKLPLNPDAVVAAACEQNASEPLTVEAFEYDVPDGAAVIVLPNYPTDPESRIRAIVYRAASASIWRGAGRV
ncbi:MAG TPA: hypothetical protein VK993_05415 [Chthoniobacterales bacterium]|nr:hypothetical protein [Chthoniobacterales bacterium]